MSFLFQVRSFVRASLLYSALLACGLLPVAACSEDDGDSSAGGSGGAPGGAVQGAADAHCTKADGTKTAQPTNMAACGEAAGEAGAAGHDHDRGGEAGASGEGGAAGEGQGEAGMAGAGDDDMDEYSPTMHNAEGDDDECKYHVSWTSTPVYGNQNVTFTVTVTDLVAGKPVTGAAPRAEVFLDTKHPAPAVDRPSVETSPGVYTVGPVLFDARGTWTVRFHFFETCQDGETSPHGHAAFFVGVP